MVRLFGLLVILGLMMAGALVTFGDKVPRPAEPVARVGEVGQADAALAATPEQVFSGSRSRPLPESIRRLTEAPQTGPSRPIVIGEAQPIPAAPILHNASLATPSAALPEGYSRVKAERANVRSGPSTQYDVVGRLSRGEEVEVLEVDPSGWAYITLQGDGMSGWISSSLLTQ